MLLSVTLLCSACLSPLAQFPPASIDQKSSTVEMVSDPSTASPLTSTATSTIVWFPATATWTPFPTYAYSATPLQFPGVGELIYQDDFSDLNTWSFATAGSIGSNSIILTRNRLTLAINQSPARLASTINELKFSQDDYYAELTISANRCSGNDFYGLMFRTAGEGNAYRFLLNCKGETSADYISAGNITTLQKWVPSGDVPPGAPGLVKVSVWASRNEMRYYLNGHYQFGVLNAYRRSGSLGVTANALSPDGMNISFSDLTIRSVDYVSPTPTITPSKTPMPTSTPRPKP